MKRTKTPRIIAPGLVLAAMNLAMPANATSPVPAGSGPVVVAQAMIAATPLPADATVRVALSRS